MNDMKYPPVFLLASERSGTNLLRRRISERQDIYFGPSPAHFLKHLYHREYVYGDLFEKENFIDMINDALSLCYVHFSPWGMKVTAEEVYDDYTLQFELRNSVLLSHYLQMRYAQEKGFRSYFCKDNHLFEYAHVIRRCIPDARFVYLHRDPRDVVLSQLKRTLMTGSVVRISEMWRREQESCIALRSHLSADSVFSVSYEHFIENEDVALEGILQYLGVKESGRLKQEAAKEGRGMAEEWANLDKPTIAGNSNKYRNEMSARDIRIIESICWDVMKELGYQAESRHRPSLSGRIKMYDVVSGEIVSRFMRVFASLKKSDYDWRIRKERSKLLKRLK